MESFVQYVLLPINWILQLRFYILDYLGKTNNQPTPLDKEGWELTFHDEFRQTELNRNVWRTDTYYGTRYHPESIEAYNTAPAQYYDDTAVRTTPYGLFLTLTRNNITIDHVDYNGKRYGEFTIPYRVGQIDSSVGFEQKYGYFEIRSQQPYDNAHWTAFWLASKYSWPPEIDIYEIWTSQRGNRRATNTIHWRESASKHKLFDYGYHTTNLAYTYNVWGCEWDEKYIKIYFNGILVSIYATPKSYIHPMHIIINTGVNHTNTGEVFDFDMKYKQSIKKVDYVKAYKKIS